MFVPEVFLVFAAGFAFSAAIGTWEVREKCSIVTFNGSGSKSFSFGIGYGRCDIGLFHRKCVKCNSGVHQSSLHHARLDSAICEEVPTGHVC